MKDFDFKHEYQKLAALYKCGELKRTGFDMRDFDLPGYREMNALGALFENSHKLIAAKPHAAEAIEGIVGEALERAGKFERGQFPLLAKTAQVLEMANENLSQDWPFLNGNNKATPEVVVSICSALARFDFNKCNEFGVFDLLNTHRKNDVMTPELFEKVILGMGARSFNFEKELRCIDEKLRKIVDDGGISAEGLKKLDDWKTPRPWTKRELRESTGAAWMQERLSEDGKWDFAGKGYAEGVLSEIAGQDFPTGCKEGMMKVFQTEMVTRRSAALAGGRLETVKGNKE